MKVLVVGSGAREHALGWRLQQHPSVSELLFAPGNPGTTQLGRNLPIAVDDLSGLVRAAQDEKVDVTIIGPELPLTQGVVDRFLEQKLSVFGPTALAAQLEGSKAFAKEIMQAAGVKTAAYQVFSQSTDVERYIESQELPIVLKADSLASGKGVVVCSSREEAKSATRYIFEELQASQCVVESFLEGVEASFIVMTDGERVVPLASSHDYKRLFSKNRGPNTGGMGTVSPTPHLTKAQEQQVLDQVIYPTLQELRKRGIVYRGFLYAGLMISPSGEISVVEFNARLGDPETQVLMRRAGPSFVGSLLALVQGESLPKESEPEAEAAVCVILAAEGYPRAPENGDEILGIELAEAQANCVVFHAGTKRRDDGTLVTAGGRVLAVTATGANVEEARLKSYQACRVIQFRGMQYRDDIAVES